MGQRPRSWSAAGELRPAGSGKERTAAHRGRVAGRQAGAVALGGEGEGAQGLLARCKGKDARGRQGVRHRAVGQQAGGRKLQAMRHVISGRGSHAPRDAILPALTLSSASVVLGQATRQTG